MSFEIKNENFSLMTKELLTNLGYKVIKEQHHIENNQNLIGLCVEFKSDGRGACFPTVRIVYWEIISLRTRHQPGRYGSDCPAQTD